jgi:RNA polymerase sigma-70 factor (ECF subfamily)
MGSVELEPRIRERLDAGDSAGAATALIEGLGPAILRFLRSMLRVEADAADAVSQWSENVWTGLPSFRHEASLKTWTYRLAWNVAQNMRHEAWRRLGQRLETGQASALAQSIRTRSVVVAERQRQALDELRAGLSEEDRTLLVLRVDQELAWNEVAEVLATEGERIEPATLMKRYERIRGRLAELARARGLLD